MWKGKLNKNDPIWNKLGPDTIKDLSGHKLQNNNFGSFYMPYS